MIPAEVWAFHHSLSHGFRGSPKGCNPGTAEPPKWHGTLRTSGCQKPQKRSPWVELDELCTRCPSSAGCRSWWWLPCLNCGDMSASVISPVEMGKIWGNRWENHGKTLGKPMGKQWEHVGKLWENDGKTMGKLMTNHHNLWQFQWGTSGKMMMILWIFADKLIWIILKVLRYQRMRVSHLNIPNMTWLL